MRNPPILCVPPAPRPLSAVTDTGGAQTWTVPAGVTQVAFPPRGAPGDVLAGACGCAVTWAGGFAAKVTATVPVTAATVPQVTDGQAGTTGDPAGSSGGAAAVTGPAGDRPASDARTPGSSKTYAVANLLLDGGPGGNADSPRQTGRCAHDGATTPGDGADRGASLAERRYVRARFGGVSVLIAPGLAAQIRAARKQQP
jgi:hypothetical protein